jgi:hypothetical protein
MSASTLPVVLCGLLLEPKMSEANIIGLSICPKYTKPCKNPIQQYLNMPHEGRKCCIFKLPPPPDDNGQVKKSTGTTTNYAIQGTSKTNYFR